MMAPSTVRQGARPVAAVSAGVAAIVASSSCIRLEATEGRPVEAPLDGGVFSFSSRSAISARRFALCRRGAGAGPPSSPREFHLYSRKVDSTGRAVAPPEARRAAASAASDAALSPAPRLGSAGAGFIGEGLRAEGR